jgi:small redox-active disulfide protein 2
MSLFRKTSRNQEIIDSDYDPNARIKVLGSGCAKCTSLANNAVQAVSNLKTNDKVTHLRDAKVIASYGVMSTPALVIDEKVVSTGKILSSSAIEKLL